MDKVYIEITEIMLKLGLQPKKNGFKYMRDAVMMYRGNDGDGKITLDFYPKISEKYGVSAEIVERAIRMLISDAKDSGGLLELNIFYDSVVYSDDRPISNSELIAIIAEIVKLNELKQECQKFYEIS